MKPPPLRVPGFRAAGVHCGIKERGLDLALIVSAEPAAAAGLFTRSSGGGGPGGLCSAPPPPRPIPGIALDNGNSHAALGGLGEGRVGEKCGDRGVPCSLKKKK